MALHYTKVKSSKEYPIINRMIDYFKDVPEWTVQKRRDLFRSYADISVVTNKYIGEPVEFSHEIEPYYDFVDNESTFSGELLNWEKVRDRGLGYSYLEIIGGGMSSVNTTNRRRANIGNHEKGTYYLDKHIHNAGGGTQVIVGKYIYSIPTGREGMIKRQLIGRDGVIGETEDVGNIPLLTYQIRENHMTAIITKNKLYFFGSYDASQGGNVYNYDRNYVVWVDINPDDTLGTWHQSTTMLPGRVRKLKAIRTKNYIYLIGGYLYPNHKNYYWRATIASDGTVGTFTSQGAFPLTGGECYSTYQTANRIYIISPYHAGGYRDYIYSAPIDSNGEIGAWAAQTPFPQVLNYNSLQVIGNYLYATAGYDGGTNRSYVYRTQLSGDAFNVEDTLGRLNKKRGDICTNITIGNTHTPKDDWLLTCKDATPGAETFSVVGSTTGAIADATYGVAYTSANINFTISAANTIWTIGDTINIKYNTKELYLKGVAPDGTEMYYSFNDDVRYNTRDTRDLLIYSNRGFDTNQKVDEQPGRIGLTTVPDYHKIGYNTGLSQNWYFISDTTFFFLNLWSFTSYDSRANYYFIGGMLDKYFTMAGGQFAIGNSYGHQSTYVYYGETTGKGWYGLSGGVEGHTLTANQTYSATTWSYARNTFGGIMGIKYTLFIEPETLGDKAPIGEMPGFTFIKNNGYQDKEEVTYGGTLYKAFMTGDSYSSDVFLFKIPFSLVPAVV